VPREPSVLDRAASAVLLALVRYVMVERDDLPGSEPQGSDRLESGPQRATIDALFGTSPGLLISEWVASSVVTREQALLHCVIVVHPDEICQRKNPSRDKRSYSPAPPLSQWSSATRRQTAPVRTQPFNACQRRSEGRGAGQQRTVVLP
jgi:hypothetical protein